MAFGTGGGLFDKPADNQPSVEELQRKVAVLEEKNKGLQEQNKIQRDSWLQLNQTNAEQQRITRELLAKQVAHQHPAAAPVAPATPASDKWEDIVNTIAGGAPSQPNQPPASALTPDILKQVVRTVIQEEGQQADQAYNEEKNFLVQKSNEFRVAYPDFAGNAAFTKEVDRAYAELKQRGLHHTQCWDLALREAAHIHANYQPRQQQQQKEQQPPAQQGQQQVPGAQYIFPMGMTGAGQGSRGKQNDNLIIDMRPPEERFKDAAEEARASREERAHRFFGTMPTKR